MPDAYVLPISLAQPELRIGDAVKCNRTGADGVVERLLHSPVTGRVIRVGVRFPTVASYREAHQVTRVAARVRPIPSRQPATVINGFSVEPGDQSPDQADAFASLPAPVAPTDHDLPPPKFWGVYLLAVVALAGGWTVLNLVAPPALRALLP